MCVRLYVTGYPPLLQSTKMILKFRETHIANLEKTRRAQSTAAGEGGSSKETAIVSQVEGLGGD